MADCSSEFIKFNSSISLSRLDRKFLCSARNAIIKKIKKYFNENDQCPKVEFLPQGSFSMGTIVKPVNGDYDIDIGVYLRGYTNWRSSWPKPETASQWLINALQNHTSIAPVNKRRCVRIEYKPSPGNKTVAYHVDLPIYCEYENLWPTRKTRIGINGEIQWSQKSDPVGFTRWFFEKCKKNKSDSKQLQRLVKYIKAWKDFVKKDVEFPSGMALTILMASNFQPHQREDLAFIETVRKSYYSLYGFLCSDDIPSPVEPYNDVTKRLTSNQKEKFKNCFEQLVDEGKRAVEEPDPNKSMLIWKSHFDGRM